AGCSRSFYTGAALGAGTAAVAYEVYNDDAMDDLEDAYDDGDISRAEYERRKDEIEDRSLVE
ncbi:MAG: SHOCT domain-containing protein, partial [Salinisphaera sp.]|nr:SHOCT domain-containing protein [Salinisphaera sp.]